MDVTTTQDLLVTVAGLDDVDTTRVEVLFDGIVVLDDQSPNLNGGIKGSFLTHAVISAAQLASGGDHRIGARAYDSAGNIGRAPEVLIHTHPDKPPTIAILSPMPGTEITIGTKLEIMVDAEDDVAVSKVELSSGTTPLGADVVAPYRFSTQIIGSPRTMTLRAVATDSSGQTAEATIAVQVVRDTRPPLVAFRAPADGERVFAGRTATVVVVASDNVGVSDVTLSVNGAGAGTGSRTSDELYQVFTWQVPVPANAAGTVLALRAVATDTSNLISERTLELQAIQDKPPVVSVLTPAPGTPYREGEDVKVAYTVADDDGVIGVAGLSGGHLFGTLPATGTKIDTSKEKVLVVWAPIVSKNEPSTVGVIARDTAGQDGQGTVEIQVTQDTEAPSAVLASPLPDSRNPSTTIKVSASGWLGMRVETEDDVRVKRVAVLVDGIELPSDAGRDWLSATNERFVETRTANPLGPGEILIGKRYYGTFYGSFRVASLSAGRHQLAARAFDPAGNATTTSSVEIEVVPVAGLNGPRVSVLLEGVPDDTHVVAGSTIKMNVSVIDDQTVTSVTAQLDGEELTLERPWQPALGVSATFRVTLPALASGEEPRAISLTATATDSGGRTGQASITRTLLPDGPPTVAIQRPTSGATLTEEQPELESASILDDVQVVRGLWLLSTSDMTWTDGGTARFAAPAARADAAVTKARLSFYVDQIFEAGVRDGAIDVVPHNQETPFSADWGQTGRLLLSVEPPAGQSSVQAQVSYRYQVNPGQENAPALATFLAQAPGGRRTVILQAPSYQVDLSFSATVMDMESVDVTFDTTGGATGVTGLAIVYSDTKGADSLQLRARAAGEVIAAQRMDTRSNLPGRSTTTSERIRVPLGVAPVPVKLTAVAVDTAGQVGAISSSHPTQPDVIPPKVALAVLPPYGSTVVDGAPFTVRLTHSDNVAVARVDILADGAVRESSEPRLGATYTDLRTTLSLTSTTDPKVLTAIGTDRAGNAAITDPFYVTVVPDAPPAVTFLSLYSAVERVLRVELDSGYVRLLQATPAYLNFNVKDDAGIASISVEYDGAIVWQQDYAYPPFEVNPTVSITPPVRADATPTVLVVTVVDNRGHQTRSRLIIETRQPQSPAFAIAVPADGATIAEGSIQLVFQGIAGDDAGVRSVELYVNGQRALYIPTADTGHVKLVQVYPDYLDEDGLPVALDPAIRFAAKTLKPPFNDVSRLMSYQGIVELPPGFVALDPSRTQTTLAIRGVATDVEGNTTVLDRVIEVVQDNSAPQVEILHPTIGRDIVEGTPVRMQVAAHDNVFVDRVELLAGPNEQAMQVVYVAAGFPPKNAMPGSPFDVYAPVVIYDLTVPLLAQLGAIDTAPYFVGARARDVRAREWRS